jgi:hypothetical protein
MTQVIFVFVKVAKYNNLARCASEFDTKEPWKHGHRRVILTINAPLILKMRDIIFFLQANYIMGHFKGYFEGAKTFLTPKLSRAQRGAILGSKKSRPSRNIPRNGPLCNLPKNKKK